MLRNYRILILIALSMLLIASMACNYPNVKNQIPQEVVPVTTEAVQSLVTDIEQAIEQALETGQLSLVLSETQLTSLVATQLQTVDEVHVTDVQILLRESQIQIQSNLTQDGIQIPSQIIASVYPDAAGKVEVNIISTKIGPLPIPDSLTNTIADTIKDAIQEEIFKNLPNLFIDAIVIADGKMSIEGHIP